MSTIDAVKFVRACVGRAEAFFSRFLIQNDLFTPIMAQLQLGGKNTCAISSAILELLSFIEKAKLTALIEHVYTKFYAIYKSECPIVFEAIRKRYEELFGTTGPCESPPKNISNTSMNGGLFVRTTRRFVVEDDEMMDWEKDNDDTETNGLSEVSVEKLI
jgi:protein phosphatase-4 regulatory subunit 3